MEHHDYESESVWVNDEQNDENLFLKISNAYWIMYPVIIFKIEPLTK